MGNLKVGMSVRNSRTGEEGIVVAVNTKPGSALPYRIRRANSRTVTTAGHFWVEVSDSKGTDDQGVRPHPLHTPEFVTRALTSTGRYPGKRRTGRSTALALRYIAKAIENPRVPIHIEDHHGTYPASINLRRAMQGMVEVLALQELYFAGNTVTFGRA